MNPIEVATLSVDALEVGQKLFIETAPKLAEEAFSLLRGPGHKCAAEATDGFESLGSSEAVWNKLTTSRDTAVTAPHTHRFEWHFDALPNKSADWTFSPIIERAPVNSGELLLAHKESSQLSSIIGVNINTVHHGETVLESGWSIERSPTKLIVSRPDKGIMGWYGHREARGSYVEEFVTRNQRAAQRAAELGEPYFAPIEPNINIGWKLHVNVPADRNDHVTGAIKEWLDQERITYKIGLGGEAETGKGLTIYAGNRDFTNELAQKLSARFGSLLPARPILPATDLSLRPAISARFNVLGGCYTPIGLDGIPLLEKDKIFLELPVFYRNGTPLKILEGVKSDSDLRDLQKPAISAAKEALSAKYGAYFSGTGIGSP